MNWKARCIILFAVLLLYRSANARNLVTLDVLSMPSKSGGPKSSVDNEQLCTLCQDYTTQLVGFFSKNETQSMIISTLHQACSLLQPIKQKCDTLADHYAAVLFMDIVGIQPEQFCKKVYLCRESAPVHLKLSEDSCTVCHQFVAEVLIKLQDPDTQLNIIETLVKKCDKMENFVQECKKYVFEYGPAVLASADKIVETIDVCAATHVCEASQRPISLQEKLESFA